MNFGTVDAADYELYLKAFIKVGSPRYAQVAKYVNEFRRIQKRSNVDVRTIKRAWLVGWPGVVDPFGNKLAPPIKDAFAFGSLKEAALANQVGSDNLVDDPEGGAASVPEASPEIAKPDAGQQVSLVPLPSPPPPAPVAPAPPPAAPAPAPRTPEGDAIAAGLNNATGFEVLIGKALHISMARLERILDRLLKDCEHHDLVPTGKLFDMLETLGKIRSQNANAAKIWVELRNLTSGQPTSINEQRHTHALSPEDREERMRQVATMAALLRTGTDSIKGYKGEQTDTKAGAIIDVVSTQVVAAPVASV
jgi:hypothetical protein